MVARLGMGEPGLNVLAGRAPGVARRQQVDVQRPTLAHWTSPRSTVQQVGKPRDIALWARHADPTRGQDRVTLGISSTIGTADCGRTGYRVWRRCA
jgi:hypothetical protein